jgi:hypothetical protein
VLHRKQSAFTRAPVSMEVIEKMGLFGFYDEAHSARRQKTSFYDQAHAPVFI